MKPTLISVADTLPQPWRNGGGSTRELLVWPSPGAWQLRLSVADIDADGPFSVFHCVQRWFVVLQGAGVALTIAGQHRLQGLADAPLRFDGADPTECQLLDGPTRDLNLMLRQCRGGMLPASPGQMWQAPGPVCGLFTRVHGHCQFKPAPDARFAEQALPAMALLWFDQSPAKLCWQPNTAADQPAAPLPQAWWLWADAQGNSP